MCYTVEQKLAAVQDYMAGTGGQSAVASRHGVDVSALRSWVSAWRAHGAAGIAPKHKRPRYSAEFRLAVLERVEKENLSWRQAAALYDIRKFDLIGRWQRLYAEGGVDALAGKGPKVNASKHKKRPPLEAAAPRDDVRSPETLLAELAQLRAENAYLKKLEALVRAKRSSATKTKRWSWPN